MPKFTRKRVLIALSAAAVLAIAAIAGAYLTAAGSGTGTGTTSATTSSMTLTGTLDSPITKIGDSEDMTISASNPGTSPEHVSSISVGAVSVNPGCPEPDAANTGANLLDPTKDSYTFSTPTTTGNEVPAASGGTPGTAVVGHVTVTFNDLPTAQNGCLLAVSGTDSNNFDVALTSN